MASADTLSISNGGLSIEAGSTIDGPFNLTGGTLEGTGTQTVGRAVQSRVENCFCVDVLHNLASDLAGCSHQPLAPFVEMVAFHNVRIWPEPLPPPETSAVRRVVTACQRRKNRHNSSDRIHFALPARIVRQIRARKRLGTPVA